MPLDRFVLILVIVVAAAAATVWLASLVAASFAFPYGWLGAVPAALIAYVVWRVVAERLAEKDDYDGIEK